METVERITSGKELSAQKMAQIDDLKEVLDDVAEVLETIDIRPEDLKLFETFEQVFTGILALKLQLMIAKQKDYKSGNIEKGGLRGLVTRTNDKIERLKSLVGDPDEQLDAVKAVMSKADDDLTAQEMDEVLTKVYKIVFPTNAVANETIDDTLMDLGNYGDIGFAFFHNAWGKPLSENA